MKSLDPTFGTRPYVAGEGVDDSTDSIDQIYRIEQEYGSSIDSLESSTPSPAPNNNSLHLEQQQTSIPLLR
eukprot:3026623-Heterocapsa_arctica.AAC.1